VRACTSSRGHSRAAFGHRVCSDASGRLSSTELNYPCRPLDLSSRLTFLLCYVFVGDAGGAPHGGRWPCQGAEKQGHRKRHKRLKKKKKGGKEAPMCERRLPAGKPRSDLVDWGPFFFSGLAWPPSGLRRGTRHEARGRWAGGRWPRGYTQWANARRYSSTLATAKRISSLSLFLPFFFFSFLRFGGDHSVGGGQRKDQKKKTLHAPDVTMKPLFTSTLQTCHVA
jgi:hypothetical protein